MHPSEDRAWQRASHVQARRMISLMTLATATPEAEIGNDEWADSPEGELFAEMIEEFTEAEAKQLLSFTMGYLVGMILEALPEGYTMEQFLRHFGLEVME